MNIPDPYSPFISISIDLAGSTKAKQIINEICKNSNDHRLQQLSAIPREVARAEAQFYRMCFSQQISLSRVFLFKTIGDEIWLSVSLEQLNSQTEIRDLIQKVLVCLIEVAGLSTEWTIFERALIDREHLDLELTRNLDQVKIFLGVKCTVDLISDSQEFARQRVEIISRELENHNLFQKGKAMSSLRENSQSLGLGLEFSDEEKIRMHYRADPIGPDVDRFFRLAGRSKAGILQIGSALWNYAQFNITPPILSPGLITSTIQKTHTNMKGILHPYETFYLPSRYCNSLTSRKRGILDIHHASRIFLIKEGILDKGKWEDKGKGIKIFQYLHSQ